MKRRASSVSISSEQISGLIDVALGKEKADMVIINGTLLNVYTAELLNGYSVAIRGDRIAYVGENADHAIGPKTEVIDATGKVLIPGLIDGHTHLIWFIKADEFLRYAMRGGTTTIITEASEMSFQLGYRGIVHSLESIRNQPIKIFATVPPMVSISQGSQASAIEANVLRKLLAREKVIGLGETFWQAAVQKNQRVLDLLAQASLLGKKCEGHTAGAKGHKLVACVASGISSCHEAVTAEEALERLRLGLHVMVRQGDIRRELLAISKIKDENIDFRRLILVTDGVPKSLMNNGYMEHVVQEAIDLGFDPIVAIQMATINIAEHFSLDGLIGGIAPGKYADIVIIPNVRTIQAECVISNGRVIARNGRLVIEPRKHTYPQSTLRSVRLPRKLGAADFNIPAGTEDKRVKVRVIDLITDLVTREMQVDIPASDGLLKPDVAKDILKVAAIGRANQSGKMFVGFVRGFKLRRGAFASSGAWDVADIIVVGANEEDMAGAVNRVVALRGGAVVYADGRVLAELPLPIGGVMSDQPIEIVAQKLDDIQQKITELGAPFPDAHLTLTTLTTAGIPHLRICEEGLVNIREGKIVGLIVR
jgi:adenine deaminase